MANSFAGPSPREAVTSAELSPNAAMLPEAKLLRKEEMLPENFGFTHGTKKDDAIRLLQAATEQHLCEYPSVDSEPLFDKIGDSAEFKAVRQASTAEEIRSVR